MSLAAIHNWPVVWQVVFYIAYVLAVVLLFWKVGRPLAKWWVRDRRRVLAQWLALDLFSVLMLFDNQSLWPLGVRVLFVLTFSAFVVHTFVELHREGPHRER